ncbi:alpha/beta hydrolase-fold protein [Nucisporomicrobium flavum]|uniref:alpha/beta hydrolase-fold protein n=1 Tax=Nucisporomicrobium flavum TaxID=2785915 RepID=UPI003C2CCF1B
MSSSFHRGRVARRFLAALVTVSMGTVTAAAGAQPAAAAGSAAPWLTVSDGFASFAVPAADIQATMGDVSSVVVEADFGPSFAVSELGLVRSGTAWTSIIGPLPAGLYRYRLRGDDTKIVKDATNPASVTSDPTWSTFLVPGDAARYLTDVPPGQGGKIETITYPYAAAHERRSATVWTPPGYDAHRPRPYPVLYLLPGEGGGHADWAELGRAGQILDNLSVERRIEPMVVVMTDGDEASRSRLRRVIDRRYHVAGDPAHQAIAGASAGGVQAVRAALARPGAFAYAGSFGGVFADETPGNSSPARPHLLRLYTGNLTDPAYNPTLRLLRRLDKAHIRHEFDGVNPDAGHAWAAWRENLVDFAPRLFQPVSDHGPSAGHVVPRHEFTPPAPGTTPTPWLTREANGDTFVTAETGTEFAGAQHVTLWGNWAPGGSWVNVPLTRSGDRWRVTVGPLKPWFYYYKFIVDRVSKKDTSNPSHITTEPTWSSFLVPGKESRLLADVPAGKGGAVHRLTYLSTVAGEERAAYVWTPPGYDPARPAPYPVLYLQHGGGQNYTDWLEMGRAKQILDNEYRDGSLVPMVVVMGNGNVPDFPKELLENLVPAARAGFHISADPERQALAGLSMGGFQTYDILKKHPGEFAYIGTFSAGISFSVPADPTGYDPVAINTGTKLLRIYTGNVTDFVYPITMASMAAFDRVGIRYEFAGVTPGPHGWDTWQKNLIDFAPRLFRSDAR